MKLRISAHTYGALLLACCAAGHVSAAEGQDETSTPRKLEAAYSITFARVSVGAVTLNAEFRANEYAITATGRVGGVMRLLLNGSAFLSAHGVVQEARPVPASFTSKMESGNEIQYVSMVLDDGNVRELEVTPPNGADAIAEEERKGIIDPLSAMLVPSAGTGGPLSQEACRRTLAVLDGRHRYDLKLAFKRMDELSADQGYKGPVVVCALTYVPIAGHGSGAPLVKYLSEGREMEVALAPVSGIPVLAPVRLFVGSWVANLVMTTTRFEASVPSNLRRPGPPEQAPK
ncbi:MAG TPA: DUF3108 domain-containing protein [Xanthobacteraceae bacterium]|jgi:hypothetical protein